MITIHPTDPTSAIQLHRIATMKINRKTNSVQGNSISSADTVGAMSLPLSNLFGMLSEAVIVSDASGQLVYSNVKADEYFPQIRNARSHSTRDDCWFDENDQLLVGDAVYRAVRIGNEPSAKRMMTRVSDGRSVQWLQVRSRAVLAADSDTIDFVITEFTDVTCYKQHEEQLNGLVNTDPLTGLSNRRAIFDQLDRAINTSRRHDKPVAVCYLDLDGFKPVNDNFGHAVGDQLLVEISARINKEVRPCDTVGRLGGDEFCIVLTDFSRVGDVAPVLNRILESIRQPYRESDKRNIHVSASMGVSLFPND